MPSACNRKTEASKWTAPTSVYKDLEIDFKYNEREENVNMSKSYEDLIADAKEEIRKRSRKAFEELLADAKAEGRAQAIAEERRKNAIGFLKANIPSETVAQVTSLPLEEVLKLAEELKNTETK